MKIRTESVLILGGGAPHIALCQNVRARGLRTVLVDYLENPPAMNNADFHVKKTCLDADIVAEIARSENARAILTTHSDRTLPVAAKACEMIGLHCYLKHETAISITSKNVMKETFRASGIPSSDWRVITAGEPPPGKIKLSYPVVCKRVNGTGSAGLFITDNDRAVRQWIGTSIGHADDAGLLVEEFRDGPEYSVDVVVIGGLAKIVATRERQKVFLSDRGFVLCHGALLDREFLRRHESVLEAIAQKVADGFKLENSPLMMQVILTADHGFSVIEVAARLSGGITSRYLSKATGVDLLDYSVSCQLGEQPTPFHEPDDMTYGVQILYANHGTISAFEGFEEALSQGHVSDFHLLRQDGDVIPEDISTKSRVAEFIVKGENPDEVVRTASMVIDNTDVLDSCGNSMMIRDRKFRLTY